MKKPFAFRAFDLRDNFHAPYPTVLKALQALFGKEAFMASDFGEIAAYYETGKKVLVPVDFFIEQHARFDSEAEAREWLEDHRNIDEMYLRGIPGLAAIDPNDPIEQQVKDAMNISHPELKRSLPLEQVAAEIEQWLSENAPA